MTLPYDYMPAVLYALDRIAEGNTQSRACDLANINIPTFEKYVNAHPELQEQMQTALRRGYDALAEALLRPDNHPLYGHTDTKMAKIMSDNIKWFLSKKKPKEYGDRVTVDVNVTADKAITDALAAGKRRASLPHMIDAEFTVLEPSDDEIMAQMLG